MSDQVAFHRLASAVIRYAPARLPGAALHDLGRYPMAALAEGNARAAQVVHGELHWLAPERYERTLARLDAYEGDGYARVRLPVVLAETGAQVEAWVYLGKPGIAERHPVVPGGDWRAYVQRRGQPFPKEDLR
jgi:gamma-glutamylcyclotransferase (GGCT)/AIG2-like uncharacterized protein YtfP